jgi:alcohol dehydrogenase
MAKLARAVVFHGSDRPLELLSLPLPALGPGEVLVRLACCTLCGSDRHTYLGHRPTPTPTILGHEMVGRITAFGPGPRPTGLDGSPLRLGDRITWSIVTRCGACFFCAHDLPQKCERLRKYGHEAMRPDFALSGGLADYCHLVAGTAMLKVPEQVPDAVVCPANCATATIAAACRVAGDLRTQTILIQGAGLLGLTACAMAASRGARLVVVADCDPERLRLAERFGATERVMATPDGEELARVVRTLTGGRGVDIAFEVSGANSAIEAALPLLRIGGRLVLVGSVFPASPVALSAEWVVRRWLTIQGVHNYAPGDLADAITFLTAHGERFPFAEVVGAPFALTDAAAAFEAARTSRMPRLSVRPDTATGNN